LVLGVAVALTAGVGRARAESVPVELQADRPGVSIGLADWDTGAQTACGAQCTLNLPPGAYRLNLTGSDGRVASRKLVVRRPSHVTVAPPDEEGRATGELIKQSGAGIAALGMGMLTYMLVMAPCNCTDHPWVTYVGASLLVGGGGLAIAGKTVEQSNSKPRLEITHPPGAGERAVGLRMSPAVGPRWTGLVLTGSF
jgi:hypothetical protein